MRFVLINCELLSSKTMSHQNKIRNKIDQIVQYFYANSFALLWTWIIQFLTCFWQFLTSVSGMFLLLFRGSSCIWCYHSRFGFFVAIIFLEWYPKIETSCRIINSISLLDYLNSNVSSIFQIECLKKLAGSALFTLWNLLTNTVKYTYSN